jgi:hypothetical protein
VLSAHLVICCTAFCIRFSLVLTFLWLVRIIQSSAHPYILTGSCIPSHISDIANMRNIVTLNTAPCTTPFSIAASFERVFPTATVSVLSFMKFSMQHSLLPSIFHCDFFDDRVSPAHVAGFGYIQGDRGS